MSAGRPDPAGAASTATANAVLDELTVDRRDLEDRVYAALRQKILTRELEPGTVLTIRQVAQALEVSPTPVRDALRRLQADGLVRERGRLGAEVVGLSAHDIVELFGVRSALETYAGRIAALRRPAGVLDGLREIMELFPTTFVDNQYTDYERFSTLDARFHMLIIEAAENDWLRRMYESLHVHIHIARFHIGDNDQRPLADLREHAAIVQALEEGNPETMAQALNVHISTVRDRLLRIMGSVGPGYRL
jgi:DNA-binding GntR family transcriptional regulator